MSPANAYRGVIGTLLPRARPRYTFIGIPTLASPLGIFASPTSMYSVSALSPVRSAPRRARSTDRPHRGRPRRRSRRSGHRPASPTARPTLAAVGRSADHRVRATAAGSQHGLRQGPRLPCAPIRPPRERRRATSPNRRDTLRRAQDYRPTRATRRSCGPAAAQQPPVAPQRLCHAPRPERGAPAVAAQVEHDAGAAEDRCAVALHGIDHRAERLGGLAGGIAVEARHREPAGSVREDACGDGWTRHRRGNSNAARPFGIDERLPVEAHRPHLPRYPKCAAGRPCDERVSGIDEELPRAGAAPRRQRPAPRKGAKIGRGQPVGSEHDTTQPARLRAGSGSSRHVSSRRTGHARPARSGIPATAR